MMTMGRETMQMQEIISTAGAGIDDKPVARVLLFNFREVQSHDDDHNSIERTNLKTVLTSQIVEAEELYADENFFASEPAAVPVIAQIVEAEEFPDVEVGIETAVLHVRADTEDGVELGYGDEEDGDSDEYGELDFGDYFDCWG
ncbi:PREDICTED: uncharacterized protein LOC101310045 [Fragaria vesca subsp. vesca]